MGEPVDGEGVADAEGAGDVAFVASVMFGGGADVPAIDAVRCHVAALVGCDVDDDSGSRWSEGALVAAEIAMEACVGGESGLASG